MSDQRSRSRPPIRPSRGRRPGAFTSALLFGIRACLASIDELARVREWGRRLHRVPRDRHPALVAFTGLGSCRDIAVAHLARHNDGMPTGPGIGPDTDRLRPQITPPA